MIENYSAFGTGQIISCSVKTASNFTDEIMCEDWSIYVLVLCSDNGQILVFGVGLPGYDQIKRYGSYQQQSNYSQTLIIDNLAPVMHSNTLSEFSSITDKQAIHGKFRHVFEDFHSMWFRQI